MVEVMKAYEEVYKKWEAKAKPNLLPAVKTSFRNNCDNDKNRNYPLNRPYYPNSKQYSRAPVSNSFLSFKGSSSAITLPKLGRHAKNFLALACPKCAQISHASLVDDVCRNLGVKNIFLVPQQNKINGYFTRTFAYISHVLKCKKFEYKEPTLDLLSCHRIQDGIKRASEEDLSDNNYFSRAKLCFEQLKSNTSSSLIGFVAWFLLHALRRIFKSVQVHQGQLNSLQQTEKFSKPVIYLPLHRSHLDYILITLVLYLNNIRAPLIAAGDNLRIPIFDKILRKLGAFFIKRKLESSPNKKDYTYRAILHSYVVESLKLGNSLEFFIEGGRSRNGKVCLPKAGLLSIIIDAYTEGEIEDAYLVPVSCSFEKLVEGNFNAEQMGTKKQKETLFGVLSNIWSSFRSNYGNVRVDFGQPFILSEYLEAIRQHLPPTPSSVSGDPPSLLGSTLNKSMSVMSLYGTDVAKEEHRQLINNVALHLIHDAGQLYCLMSTHLLAFLLLNGHRKGVSLKFLVTDFQQLRSDLEIKKRNIGFSGSNEDVIIYSATILGNDLVEISETGDGEIFIKPCVTLPSVLELSYYSAPVVSTYFCQSVVALAILANVNADIESLRDNKSEIVVLQDDILQTSLILCNIMQFEHIFCPPCEDLGSKISELINDLITQEILQDNESLASNTDYKNDSLAEAMTFSTNNEDELWRDHYLTVNLSSQSVDKLYFLKNVLSPYMECYWVTSIQLYKLICNEMEEEAFLKLIQKDIHNRLELDLLLYSESIALETIKNAIKLLETWNVIERHIENNIKLVYLADGYQSSDKISSVVAKIQAFRV